MLIISIDSSLRLLMRILMVNFAKIGREDLYRSLLRAYFVIKSLGWETFRKFSSTEEKKSKGSRLKLTEDDMEDTQDDDAEDCH